MTQGRIAIKATDPTQLQQLLAECALGNQRSFETLYRSVSGQLYAVALKSLRREDWAEEVLQESFIRIWHNAGRYDVNLSAPMTWMINITRNLAIDQLRRHHEQPLPDEDSPYALEPQDERPGPLDQSVTAQENAALNRCLDTLEGKQRQSIIIAYFQGISYSDLAQQMQAPLGSVKSWIRRGMERLRTCLEG
ncbi:sigma-70 family RNA polymerase sigma factor [Herbaspirillum lusitanum]|jgi:RNA polymerase sigma-70 factor (ECF subfamily)|uniref:Sigma-70 family RNA polymerase sigma factor n=1 Tax=Herbaspirillum lusitanum TaxID=213312 RepID=A0ABW9A3C3_9BURK